MISFMESLLSAIQMEGGGDSLYVANDDYPKVLKKAKPTSEENITR